MASATQKPSARRSDEEICSGKLRHQDYLSALLHARSLRVDNLDIYHCGRVLYNSAKYRDFTPTPPVNYCLRRESLLWCLNLSATADSPLPVVSHRKNPPCPSRPLNLKLESLKIKTTLQFSANHFVFVIHPQTLLRSVPRNASSCGIAARASCSVPRGPHSSRDSECNGDVSTVGGLTLEPKLN